MIEGNGGRGSRPAVVVITVDDFRVVEANAEAAALVGIQEPKALIGLDAVRTFLDVTEQPDAEEAMSSIGDPAPLHVHEYVRTDGTIGRVEVSATPMTWQGRPARRWFAWGLPDNPGCVVVAKDCLEIKAADDEAVRFYGASSADDLVGHRLDELFAGGDKAGLLAHLEAEWRRAVPAPMRTWVVHRLDGAVTRGRFWSAPEQPIDGAASIRFYCWPAERVELAEPAIDEVMDYPDSHRLLVDESGTIIEANQAAADQLGLAKDTDLIGRSMFEFVPDYHTQPDALDRWHALFDLEEVSPLRLRIAKRIDGEERCVLSATVPGPVVEGRRTLWVNSWTINGPASEPITTRTPVGFLVSEAWRLEQRTDLLLRSQEHLAVAQERAIAEVETELRADLRQAAAASTALVSLAARVDQLEAQVKGDREDLGRLQVQMKQVVTAASAVGERAIELVKTDPGLAAQVQELLLTMGTIGRQLQSLLNGAAEASEPS
ncbi:MAG: PAS domain-containing protein [Acidimicrobiia bacterium]|nr:PAS domain-containing protein [Acidimicrobiia bacterium]